MVVSFKLALKYLKKNKKRSIGAIITITIATMLLISVVSVFNVYQNYMIEVERSKENWETRFNNISYEKLYGFEENSDIKDISIVQNLGTILLENDKSNVTQYVDLKAYEQNAFKNLDVKLIEGRLPSKYGEIVVSKNFIGDVENIKLNDKSYKIVGVIEPTKYENISFNDITISAITYLDKEKLKKDSSVDVYVNFYNNKNVYEVSKEIATVLKLYPGDEVANESIQFNTELLHYYSVWDMNSEEDKIIITVMSLLIVLIVSISIALVFSIFNISMRERNKEFAILNSIGATRKQILKMILCEAGIILVISLLIAIILTTLLILLTSNYFDSLLSRMDIYLADAYNNIISATCLAVPVILIAIATFIGTIIPVMKIKNMSVIEVIKGNSTTKKRINISSKSGESIEKILTRRNKKLNPYRHKIIIFSFTISIFLLLLTQGYSKNINIVLDNKYICNYTVSVPSEYAEEIKQEFIGTNTVQAFYSYVYDRLYTQLEDEDINVSLKQAITKCSELEEQIFYTSTANELDCNIYAVSDNELETYLKKIGIKELKDNECILINYSNAKTDYYDGVYMTNYAEGDNIEVYLKSKSDGAFELNSMNDLKKFDDIDIIEYGDNQRKIKLNIAKVVSELPSAIKPNTPEIPNLCIVVKESSLNNVEKFLIGQFMNEDEERNYQNLQTTIDVYAENRELLDEAIEKIKIVHNVEDLTWVYLEPEYDIEKIEITKVFLGILTILIFTITLINIINIIISDIAIRKQYFSILISIGMIKKQLAKIILSEYMKYFIISLLLGTISSLTVTYWFYKHIYNNELYLFKIPFEGVVTVVIIFIVILMVIRNCIYKNTKKNSIIDDIRNERY